MSILYLRHPSRASSESGLAGLEPACHFAWVAENGAILQQGTATLAQLAATIAQAKRVILLLSASDVTLMRMKVPKLSAARLRSALPNLVEDRLISDPAESVIVAGPADAEGMRNLAAVQRPWLEMIAKSLRGFGAQKITMVPSQLCLPNEAGRVGAVIEKHAAATELALRLSENEGIGLPMAPESGESLPAGVMRTIRVLAHEAPVTLWVPESELSAYCEAADAGTKVEPDDWGMWIRGTRSSSLDLVTGLPGFGAPAFDWKRWRWPMILAVAVVAVNLAGMYFGWWHLKREADALRSSMTETYRSVFPQETVIVDPAAQMNQKLAAARRNAGQLADDDFVALSAALGETLGRIAPRGQPQPAIAALEYREGSLTVRWKGEAPRLEDARSALAARNLSLTQTGAGMWQIRSAK